MKQAGILGLVLLLVGVSSVFGRERGTQKAAGEPLRFSLIDQLPPEVGSTAINSIEERRRLVVFNAALQTVVREGKLPSAELINNEPALRAGIDSERPQPPGTLITRIFLTQWSQTRLGGTADTEVLCRFFVEEVRDGHRVAKLGPFFSRVNLNLALAPRYEEMLAIYRTAAVKALEQMAVKLPR